MSLFGSKAEAELERVAQKAAIAYQQVCEMYIALYREGRVPSLAEIDSLRKKIEVALPWLESEPTDEATFRQVQGID